MISSGIPVRGYVDFEVKAPDGRLLHRGEGSNLVTTQGKAWLVDRLTAEVVTPEIAHMKGSTGTAVPLESDTDLDGAPTYIFEENTADAAGYDNGTIVDNTIRWKATFANTSGSDKRISEIGLFDTSVHTILLARFLTQVFDVVNGATLTINWTLTVG